MRRRSLLLMGPRQLAWVEEEIPPLAADEVLVETRSGAISIGSEIPQYRGDARAAMPPAYPRMTGYESLGSVVTCGPDVRRLTVGDRVVAFYGHRTHGVVPEAKAIRVPDGVPDELALLVILSCDTAKGIRKVLGGFPDAAPPQGPVLVTGAGTIGLLTLFALRAIGTEAVDVVEPRAERRELARRLGARSALPPDMLIGRGALYPIAFECSSRNAAFGLAQKVLQPGGTICVLADGNLEPLVLSPRFHEKELTVVGSSDGRDYQQHAVWYFDIVREGWGVLAELFAYRTSAEELADTFMRLADEKIAPTKVFVNYG